MKIHTHHMVSSGLSKQVLGAVGGMAIAGLVYVAVDQLSLANIKGYLVDVGQNISENAGVVNVNNKNADPDTLKRIASRAQAVQKQLDTAATDTGTPQTALNQNTEIRKAVRVGNKELASVNANPTEYQGTHTLPVSEEQRLAARAAETLAAMQAGHAGAPLYQPSQAVISPEEAYKGVNMQSVPGSKPFPVSTIPAEAYKGVVPQAPVVIQGAKPLQTIVTTPPAQQVPSSSSVSSVSSASSIAPVVPEVVKEEPFIPRAKAYEPVPYVPDVQYGKNLPDSGPVLNAALLLSAVVALAIIRPDLKGRLIALIAHRS